MWSALNQAVTAGVDALLWPLAALPDGLQLALLGAPAALLALAVFRLASDQDALQRAKERIQAHLLELVLFRDDLRVTLGAQLGVLRANLAYLRHVLVPLVMLAGPFALVLVQVEARFAQRSLDPGESTLLTVELAADGPAGAAPELQALPDGLALDAPPVRIAATREVVWRLRAARPGSYEVGIRLGDGLATRRIQVGTRGRPLAPVVLRQSDPHLLAYPGERGLPDGSPVRALRVDYPRARGAALGLCSASWIFLAAALAWGFALRRPLGVRF